MAKCQCLRAHDHYYLFGEISERTERNAKRKIFLSDLRLSGETCGRGGREIRRCSIECLLWADALFSSLRRPPPQPHEEGLTPWPSSPINALTTLFLGKDRQLGFQLGPDCEAHTSSRRESKAAKGFITG